MLIDPQCVNMASGSDQLARDAEDDQGDTIINMVDYLKEKEELENDADAVLGGSDEHHCTYPMGYVGRQALYACSSCSSASKAPAGVCLACSYDCHEGHDLYELYTKRNFCCDCGNKKFGESKCKLYPDKEEYNSQNRYNQNFDGVYCTCSRPYPDPEDEVEDEMIQCIICEDWFHGRHLGAPPPADFQEMICQGCMSKHEFLWAYTVNSKETVKLKSEETEKKVDIEKNENEVDSKAERATEDTKPKAEDKGNERKETCVLKELKQREITVKDCATYWPEGFRSKLCTCNDCMDLYREHDLMFLTDESDTVAVYELKGMAKKTPSTQEDKERQALQSMNHIQQIEVVQGFNDLKSELSEFLKHFAENGKVVREEDIREFFTQMQARKRQKTDNIPGYFCK